MEPYDLKLCRPLTVPSKPAEENGLKVKRRRVTREMEGKYIINMPKGTTARTRYILAQQEKKGTPEIVYCVESSS